MIAPLLLVARYRFLDALQSLVLFMFSRISDWQDNIHSTLIERGCENVIVSPAWRKELAKKGSKQARGVK